MNRLDDLRALAFSFEGTREEYPWEHTAPVFKTAKGKMFIMSVVEGGVLRITVKLTPNESAEARMLPFITVAPYVGKHGWVSVRISNDFEWETAVGLIRRSHELVSAGPRGAARLRRATEQE